ncbi:MAG: ribonuclease III [Chloroflexi bacterium]|nr:ribonuclease III [Chloroflexota bacterium]
MASNHTDPLRVAQDYETLLGVSFANKSLLLRALTHRSYLNEAPFVHADNERLEFLGDAVIDLIVAEVLYQRFPEQREGPLTSMRASLVRRETLAAFARIIDLGEHLFLGKGEEENGGRERDAILCAGFEALVGALYLDQDLASCDRFLRPFVEPALIRLREGQLRKDAKSRLQEWSQAETNLTPRYVTVGSSGPDHAKEFLIEVRIGDETYGKGSGKSKQLAAQAAAQAALDAIASHSTSIPSIPESIGIVEPSA